MFRSWRPFVALFHLANTRRLQEPSVAMPLKIASGKRAPPRRGVTATEPSSAVVPAPVTNDAKEKSMSFTGETEVFLPPSKKHYQQHSWSHEWADIALTTTAVSVTDPSAPLIQPLNKFEAWEARKKEFSQLRHQVLLCLQSHHDIRDKALLTLALFDRSVERHLVFHPFIYERMLDMLRMAVHPDVQPGIRAARYRPSNVSFKGVTPHCPVTNGAWNICEFMFHAAVSMTADAAENMMVILAKSTAADPETERRAHELVLRLDALRVRPTKCFLSHYFDVCAANNCMHLAVARYGDAKLRHEISPDAAMATRIISGLIRNNQVPQSLKFIATLGNVAVDRTLVNACVDAARRGPEPLGAFDMWLSVANVAQFPLDEYTVTSLMSAVIAHRASFNGAEFVDLAHIEAAPKGAGSRAAKLRVLTREIVRSRVRLSERTSIKFATVLHAAVLDLAVLAVNRAQRGGNPSEFLPETCHQIFRTATILRRRIGGFDRSTHDFGVTDSAPTNSATNHYRSAGKITYMWRWAIKIDHVAERVGLPRLTQVTPKTVASNVSSKCTTNTSVR